ncbi:FGGY-family carbohydrate kinase [Paracoccus spongiarum]|uniref:FGGY family carbohydrate kinase n=1 Tax=Paracoccus spongiarum TaxID=3064387 RepID=A0ABT9JBU0_9RHOB|nr:FGGY family carbohydrate kinase [Paracoccus sp. 2205BS29-5]MDP5306617.1 FGGY family carbohydrate kinase [Paracoccus sp. 2205BS29-5]
MTRIAVIDIGKTNAKLALVEGETLAEIAVVTRPNRPRPGPPWPQFDLEGLWDFFLHHLAGFHAAHGIDAISVATHGASGVVLGRDGGIAAPMLDYEHPGPDGHAAAYDAIRPDFAQTGSPRLPAGLNLGAQLHWMLHEDPGLAARLAHVVTYPQYWGWRLTGEIASDVTSLGCHTDLWNPWAGDWSDLPGRLGLAGLIAPPRHPGEMLGRVTPQVAAATGLAPATPVAVGIHDSNASLYPHVLGRAAPFSVVSTGTWVVAMAIGGARGPLDARRDVLVNVNALGQPVPSARFMGGRKFQIVGAGDSAPRTEADRQAALRQGLMLLPAVEPGSGPFPGRRMRWTAEPGGAGPRMVALSWYLALMTDACLGLIGARGPVVVEGPFARNPDYLDMLAALRPDGVETAGSATGTSVGAALLCLTDTRPPATRVWPQPADRAGLAAYGARWQAAVAAG